MLWDNALAHPPKANALRGYLATPGLCLRLVSLPRYSPDFNTNEAIGELAHEGVTVDLCPGPKAPVQGKKG